MAIRATSPSDARPSNGAPSNRSLPRSETSSPISAVADGRRPVLNEAAPVEPAEARPRTSGLVWCGCLLLLLYVVPLFFPPGPVAMWRPGPDTGLLARLFPDVPAWWMVGRLAALAIGAALVAWACRRVELFTRLSPARAAEPARDPRSGAKLEWTALGLAALLAVAATRASTFPRWGQIVFVLAPLLPVIVLRMADARDGPRPRHLPRVAPGWWIAVAFLITGWVVWRVILASHDPRAADFVDMWKNFTYFLDAASRQPNLISQESEPGVSNVFLLGFGIQLVGPGKIEPSWAWVQRAHGLWIALTAFEVAFIVRRFAGPALMLPAVAALLFSPFIMSLAICATPLAFATALIAFLLLLVCRIHESPSRAEVAVLGALAGAGATYPHAVAFAAAATVAVLPCVRRSRPSFTVWAAAALLGIAAVLPTLPGMVKLAGMTELYVNRRGVVSELEPLIRGQKFFPMPEVDALWRAGERGPLDIPLAALLQPFAIPRTPVRLSGDVYYEPIGAALAAVGLALCVTRLRRSWVARGLLAAMLVSLLPGAVTSAFDRASLTRNLGVPVLLPVFTALGLIAMRRRPGVAQVIGLTAAIVLSGVAIFDVVNPRIVATSWQGLTLRAVASTPADDVMLLEHGPPPRWWMYVAEIAHYVPPTPLRTRPYLNAGSLLADPERDVPAAPVILWSPGLEEEQSIRQNLCGCWPDARVFTMHDRSGLSSGFAAGLRDAAWEPALPRDQWSVTGCSAASRAGISCEVLRALAHYNEAHVVADAGYIDEAIAHYREALRLAPDYVGARNELGLALASRGRPEEAIAEFREVLRLHPGAAAAHNGLAIALEGAGRLDEAIAEYREAVRLAPGEPRGRLNLAAAFTGHGRLDEAVAQYREVLRLAPDLPEAHLGLGHAFAQQGRARDAVVEYRAALVARPRWRPAALALAWMLATSDDRALRNPAEAVMLAEQATSDSGGGDAAVLRTLAVAYAAAGRFDQATATAERGLAVARAAGEDDLVRELGERITAYRAGRAAP